MKAEESLVPAAEPVLEELNIPGKVIPLTGRDGIMDKVFVMDAIGCLAEERYYNPTNTTASICNTTKY